MISRRLKKTGIALFIVIIFTPFIGHIFKVGQSSAKLENRALAPVPGNLKDLDSLHTFPDKFDDYLNDHFGLKKNLSYINANLLFHLFKISPALNITIGNDGYLFFNSHTTTNKYSLLKGSCLKSKKSVHQSKKILGAIKDITAHLASRGGGFEAYFIIIPTKSKIYPEKLPGNLPYDLKKKCSDENPGLMGVFYEKFSNEDIVKERVFYPLNLLRSGKDKYQVYHKTMFHWKGEAPYVVAQKFLKDYIQVSDLPELSYKESKTGGDLNHLLSGMHFYSKWRLYNFKEAGMNICRGSKCFPKINPYINLTHDTTFITNKNIKERSVLLLSDSFGAEIAPAISTGFENTLHTNFTSTKDQTGFFDNLKTFSDYSTIIFLFHDSGALTPRIVEIATNLKKLNELSKYLKPLDSLGDFVINNVQPGKKIIFMNDNISSIKKISYTLSSRIKDELKGYDIRFLTKENHYFPKSLSTPGDLRNSLLLYMYPFKVSNQEALSHPGVIYNNDYFIVSTKELPRFPYGYGELPGARKTIKSFDGKKFETLSISKSSSPSNVKKFTIEMWIKNTGENIHKGAYSKTFPPTSFLIGPFSIIQPRTDLLRIFTKAKDGKNISYSINEKFLNRWLHVELDVDNEDSRSSLFINGEKILDIKSPTTPLTKNIYLGKGYKQRFWKGQIAGLRISSTIRHTENFDPGNITISKDKNTLYLMDDLK